MMRPIESRYEHVLADALGLCFNWSQKTGYVMVCHHIGDPIFFSNLGVGPSPHSPRCILSTSTSKAGRASADCHAGRDHAQLIDARNPRFGVYPLSGSVRSI